MRGQGRPDRYFLLFLIPPIDTPTLSDRSLLFNESKKASAVADRHRTKIAKGLRSEIAMMAKVILNEMGD